MWPPCPPGAPTQRRPYSGSPRPSRHPGIESGGMELISTHLGADFDAFASMLAARRLHPGAELFFPGSREGSLRRTIEARRIEVPELRHRDVDPAELTRVILCDIRQRDRIGIVAEWLEANPRIEVWAYDHHPPSSADLAVAGGIVDPAAGLPGDLPHRDPEMEIVPQIARQPCREAVVAFGHPSGPHGFLARLSRLPGREREGAQLRGIGGVESLDEEASGLAGPRQGLAAGSPGQEIGERDVLLPRVDGVEDAVDLVPEALVPMKMTVLGQPEIAFEVVVGEAGLPQQALGERRLAVDEFGPQLERHGEARVPVGEDAPADAVPGLVDGHPEALPAELARRREPRDPRPDHRGVDQILVPLKPP